MDQQPEPDYHIRPTLLVMLGLVLLGLGIAALIPTLH